MTSNKAVAKMMNAPTGAVAFAPLAARRVGLLGEDPIAPLVEEMLGRPGEDPKRDGLVRTPLRVDKALRFLTSGYQMKIEQILNGALYEVKYDEMVDRKSTRLNS